MSDGRVCLAIVAVIAAGVFANGWRFARMKENPFAGRTMFALNVEGHDMSLEKLRWIGREQMIFAPLFLAFFALLAFGALGPVNGITIIELQ